MASPNDAASRIPDGLEPLDRRPGPALPLTRVRAAALVAAALDRAERPARAPSRRRLLLIAAAIVALASVAAASGLYLALSDPDSAASSTTGEGEAHAKAHAREEEHGPNRTAALTAAPRTPGATPAPTSPTMAPDLPVPAPAAPATAPATSSPESTALPAPEPASAAPAISSAAPPAVVEAPAPVPAAEDLLLRANRLRAERRWADAERTYAQVLRAAPGSDAAYAAAVAAAALRLERLGRPRDALDLYERVQAERPRGALAEEAAFGVAECRRALGDAAGEAEALRRFLADWPAALTAERARARLEDLEATTGP